MLWNDRLRAPRAAVLMQGSSLLGVSFTRPLHAFDDGSADAPDGAIRPTTRQPATSHDLASRDFTRCGMRPPPSNETAGGRTGPAPHMRAEVPAARTPEPDV